MENTAVNARRCHLDRHNSSCFHPSNRAEVFTWQNFQPAYRDRGWKNRDLGHPSQPALSYEHIENFTTGLEARRDLGNLAYVGRPLIMSYTELN